MDKKNAIIDYILAVMNQYLITYLNCVKLLKTSCLICHNYTFDKIGAKLNLPLFNINTKNIVNNLLFTRI